jgi:hypothetical protein
LKGHGFSHAVEPATPAALQIAEKLVFRCPDTIPSPNPGSYPILIAVSGAWKATL